VKTYRAAEGKAGQASSQQTPSPSNAHAAVARKAPQKHSFQLQLLPAQEKSPPSVVLEQSFRYLHTLRQLVGPALQGFWSRKWQTLCRKLLLTRVWLAKNKINQPQTPSNKQLCFLLLCKGTEGNGGMAQDGLGRDGVNRSHRHPAPASQGTSNKQKCNVSWDSGSSLQGRDAFSPPGSSLYELSEDTAETPVTTTKTKERGKSIWSKGRPGRSRAGALPFSPGDQRDLLPRKAIFCVPIPGLPQSS